MTTDTDSTVRISPSGLMDLENAAKYLGVDLGTIRWIRRMKKLPFVKIGAKLMVKQSALDAYIDRVEEPARTG